MGFNSNTFRIDLVLILFFYGLVFFSLGLVVAFFSRRSSRLELARSLKWLAAFGLLHGLNEWSELFLLSYSDQLGRTLTLFLENIQLILLAVSFTCLLLFGISLVYPFMHRKGLYILPVILCTGILIGLFSIAPLTQTNYPEWRQVSTALVRYGLCLPGALLAAYGLRRQAREMVRPLDVPAIYNMLQIAGIGLVFYGFFAGLVVPPVNFFPGNWLNSVSFLQIVGLPVIVFRSAVGIILAVTIIRALEIFDIETERHIESIELQQILAAERERIGRDLHDGTIQKVYTAGLMVESALHAMDAQSEAEKRLRPVLDLIQDTIADLRQNLTVLHPTHSGERLSSLLQQLSEEARFRGMFTIQLMLDSREGEPSAAVQVHQIMAIANEALSNVARHANASKVLLSGKSHDGMFTMTIEDNGIGMAEDARLGFGLRNMRDRTRLLNGKLDLLNAVPHGTIVKLTIPVRDESD